MYKYIIIKLQNIKYLRADTPYNRNANVIST